MYITRHFITSMLSLAMNKPVKKDLAMTGEVTLMRKILPIGGVKEKTIAARRSEVKTMVFRPANRRDFDELAANVKAGIEVHFVDDYSQIYALAFDENEKAESSENDMSFCKLLYRDGNGRDLERILLNLDSYSFFFFSPLQIQIHRIYGLLI